MTEISSNKRIATNTLMLYFRMLISMAVSLYTSRIVLSTLGVVDFGIYNVVGGIIIMLGFLNHAMTASTQRFLIFELGKKDFDELKKVFNMSIVIHVALALLIFILAETIGLWFFKQYLKIPNERMYSANWVYHFSVFSFIATIISVPYNALIIAHEKMKAFAIIGIFEVFLKLAIVFLLMFISYDKLTLYAVLIFIVTLIITGSYFIFSKLNFIESKGFSFNWDKILFLKMSNFAGWNLLGVTAGLGYIQGINVLLNIFFGPTVNAARGIAFQVQGALNSFVSNFQVAVNPSITKNYAQNEFETSFKLVFGASKFSFFLLLLLSMPILIETQLILKLWLKIVPNYTIIFTRLVIIDILIGSISGAIQNIVQASGEIRKYQLIVSGILLLNLPASYVFLKIGYSPESTMFISIFFSIIALLARLLIVKSIINFPSLLFIKNVLLSIIAVTTISYTISFFAYSYFNHTIGGFILLGFVTSFSIIISILLIGLNKLERIMIINKVKILLKINY